MFVCARHNMLSGADEGPTYLYSGDNIEKVHHVQNVIMCIRAWIYIYIHTNVTTIIKFGNICN